ncbi:hypothetical protein OG21DRAFT_1504752 [Imleria badia]|nr:hypothetical protein OG21DRAFT_1504752 [Imleria badia]
MVQKCLRALEDELHGIENSDSETQEVLGIIWNHIHKVEDIVQGTKNPRLTFSTVTAEDLEKAGVQRKCLVFEPAKVIELTNALPTSAETEIADLRARVKKIYAHVNIDYESSSRMILDGILLTSAVIASTQTRGVVILPEMRITKGDGVCISHPASGYELWLSDVADYAVIEYEDMKDFKARVFGSRTDVFSISRGSLFLVEAKHQGLDLSPYIPEAVGRAIALLKSSNFSEARFCLSDGTIWMFFLVKMDNGTLTYYESAKRYLDRAVLENSDLPLREIVQLVHEWLAPTVAGLFTLE